MTDYRTNKTSRAINLNFSEYPKRLSAMTRLRIAPLSPLLPASAYDSIRTLRQQISHLKRLQKLISPMICFQ